MDTLKKIKDLTEQRGWTINYLAKKAGLTQSTISGLFLRNNYPTVPTLERICDAFGITLSSFFSENGEASELTAEQKELLSKWAALSEQHKKAVMTLIENL